MSLTCLPCRVSQCLRVLGPCVRHRHRLVCSGLLVLHLVYGERANRKAVARHGPAPLAYQHDRRLPGTAYGCTKTWLWWFAAQVRQAFPPIRGWPPLSGRRQDAPGHAGAPAAGGSEHASQPVPSFCLWRSERHPPGPMGCLSPPPRCRLGPAPGPAGLPNRAGPVALAAARLPAPGLGPGTGGHRRCGLCLPSPCGADPHAGLWGRDGPAPALEVRPWEGAQSPRHPVVSGYVRRGVELLCKELTGVVGVGQHQVANKTDRVERSVAVAIMVYVLLRKLRAQEVPADRPWSAFRLHRACAWTVAQAPCERSARQMARQWLQLGNAA
jgi:hypothetical protein